MADENAHENTIYGLQPQPLLTVADLIQRLQCLPKDAVVILQRDALGMGYAPLDTVDDGDDNLVFVEQFNAQKSTVKYRELTPDLIDDGIGAADVGDPSCPLCIVLCPKY